VTGYPTLLLFRSIQSEKSSHCVPSEMWLEPSWIIYHGDMKVCLKETLAQDVKDIVWTLK